MPLADGAIDARDAPIEPHRPIRDADSATALKANGPSPATADAGLTPAPFDRSSSNDSAGAVTARPVPAALRH